MNLIRTFQSIPAVYGIEGPPQSKTQQSQETLAPRPEVASFVMDEANQLSVGEEWKQIQLALAGGCDALSTLFARHKERLYGAAFSLLRNKEDAEDALQDGLLSAYVNLRSFEGRARFSTWLTRIVFNAAFMKHRRLRAHPQQPLDDLVVNDGPARAAVAIDETPDPEQLLARVETRAVLKNSDRSALVSSSVGFPSSLLTRSLDSGSSESRKREDQRYKVTGISCAEATGEFG